MQPLHAHQPQWLSSSSPLHHFWHSSTFESPSCCDSQPHMSQPRHLQSPQCEDRSLLSQKGSHDSIDTSPSTPELHVFAAASEQKSQPRHLQVPQCVDAKVASQNGSHASYEKSSVELGLHGGPRRQKPHALHLQRPQWSSR